MNLVQLSKHELKKLLTDFNQNKSDDIRLEEFYYKDIVENEEFRFMAIFSNKTLKDLIRTGN